MIEKLLLKLGIYRIGVSAARERHAMLFVASALCATLAAAIAFFKLVLMSGLGGRGDFVQGLIAASAFFVCVFVSMWSFRRLRNGMSA
jgi:hypothetical protein